MLVLITYDVNTSDKDGARRLNKIAKECVNFGQRVQNSVFECEIDYARFLQLREKITKLMDDKKDSVRFYKLGNNGAARVEHYGAKTGYDPKGTLIV